MMRRRQLHLLGLHFNAIREEQPNYTPSMTTPQKKRHPRSCSKPESTRVAPLPAITSYDANLSSPGRDTHSQTRRRHEHVRLIKLQELCGEISGVLPMNFAHLVRHIIRRGRSRRRPLRQARRTDSTTWQKEKQLESLT